MNEIHLMWVDPGVTTGIAIYRRWANGVERCEWKQRKGLASTCRFIDAKVVANMHLGYESFYIGERTTKAEVENVRAATDIIGWIKASHAMDKFWTRLPLLDQHPRERTPKVITPEVVERCLGEAPTGQKHAMDAARHIVRYLVSTKRDPTIRERYADAT